MTPTEPIPTPLAGESATLEERLRRRTEQVLPDDWQEGLKCPGCDMSADRQKCAFELGGGCPRHYPENYDPDPRVEVPDPLCTEVADELARLTADVERLTAANDAGNAHLLSARADLEDAIRDKDAADARAERYRKALRSIVQPMDCGCAPCRGECRSEGALQIEVEEMKQTAEDALTEGAENAD